MKPLGTKQIIGLVLIAVLAAAGIFLFGPQKLVKAVRLVVFEINGVANGKAALNIDLGSKVTERKMMTAFLDLNNDGKFSDDEKIIGNMKVLAGMDKTQGFAFAAPKGLESQKSWNVKIQLGSESFENKAELTNHDFGNMISLAKVKHPTEANLGMVDVAYAQPTVEGHCDSEWAAIQAAYDAAMNDISNDKLYNNYKKVRKDWDDCFKKYRAAVDQQAATSVSVGVKVQDVLDPRASTETPTTQVRPQVGQTVVRTQTTEKPGTGGEQAAPPDNGDVMIDDIPHITQKTQECGPTSITQNLTALAKRNGQSPQDTAEMIKELKTDLYWTIEDGVLKGDMITGKVKYAQRHNLPIQTNLVGDGKRSATPQDISDALKGKGVVEQRIIFVDADGNQVGAHIVSAIGASPDGGIQTVTFNDPMSDDESNSFVVNEDGEIENYEGAPAGTRTYMGLAWVQTWGTPPLTGIAGTMEEKEIQGVVGEFGKVGTIPRIEVVVSGDHKIPIAQVYLSNPGQCGEKHWHAAKGGSARDIEGNVIADHEPCGYGKQSEAPVQWIPDPNFKPAQ